MINSFLGKYRFLSNFYHPAVVIYNNISYPTVEHAYQAAKSLEIADHIAISRILGRNAYDAKNYGRTIQLRSDWESIKQTIMLDLVRQKFSKPFLKEKLLDTSDQELIEGNTWHDNYWGVCFCTACSRERNRENPNLGLNWLGTLLMHVRQEVQIENSM